MTYPKFLKVIKLDICDSTNNFLKKDYIKFQSEFPALITAKEQTEGRGRETRKWFSEKNKGLYSSFAFFIKNKKNLNLLSLITGVTVSEILNKISNKDFKIKWPNDILYKSKKIAGILIENIIFEKNIVSIVGIGINLNHEQIDFPDELKEHAISLKMVTGKSYDVEKVNVKLSRLFFKWLYKLENDKKDIIIQRYNKSCFFQKGKKILFYHNKKIIQGIYKGINKEGGLILEHGSGTESIFFSGEICTTPHLHLFE